MSGLQINTDAEEYVPQNVRFSNQVKDITVEAFDFSNLSVSEGAIRKLSQIIQTTTIPKAAFHVGEAIIRTAFIKSGYGDVAFKVLKGLQDNVLPDQAELLERGFLEEIHNQTIQVVVEESLKEVANNTELSKKTIAFCAELVHLITHSIITFQKPGLECSPLSCCIDICLITGAALRTQLALSKDKKAVEDPKTIRQWDTLIVAFVEGLKRTLSNINTLLQISDNVTSSSCTFITTECLREPTNPPVLKSNPGIKEADTLKIAYLPLLLDEVLLLLKYLVIIDNGLPTRWVRSTAMDVLLMAAVKTPKRPLRQSLSDFEEEGNIFDQENPELMDDFEKFLMTSGQLGKGPSNGM